MSTHSCAADVETSETDESRPGKQQPVPQRLVLSPIRRIVKEPHGGLGQEVSCERRRYRTRPTSNDMHRMEPNRAPTRPTRLQGGLADLNGQNKVTHPLKTGIAEAITYENKVQPAVQENQTT